MAIAETVDGFQRVLETIHTTSAVIANDFSNAGDVAGSQIIDSTSNGVSLVKGKAVSLEKTKLLRASHVHHKYILKIVHFMLRNSLINKSWIMAPGFAASLFIPAPVLQALRPAFALFGAHLGMEAAKDTKKLVKKAREQRAAAKKQHAMGKAPDPDEVLQEKIPDKMTIREAIKKAHKADMVTTGEVTVAVLSSIDNLPISQQVPIMALYVAGMTAGVYGMTTALVKMEDWGQRLEAWQPQHPFSKAIVNTTVPARIGLALQQATPRVFRVLPWTGAAAKFVTCGRVISHASHTIEHIITGLSPIDSGLIHIATDVAGWGVTGIIAGLGTEAARKLVYRPLYNKIENSAALEPWRKAASAACDHVMDYADPVLGYMKTRLFRAGDRALHFAADVTAWGPAGALVNLGAEASRKIVYEPLRTKVETSPMLARWRNAAGATLISTALSHHTPRHEPVHHYVLRRSKRAEMPYIAFHRPSGMQPLYSLSRSF